MQLINDSIGLSARFVVAGPSEPRRRWLKDNMKTIEIPMKTPSLNEIQGHHWARKNRIKKIWENWIKVKSYDGRGLKGPYKNVKITCHRKRLLDPDNFIGGCKGLVDALKSQELIKDDSKKHVSIEYEQIRGKDEMTIIELWGETQCQKTAN